MRKRNIAALLLMALLLTGLTGCAQRGDTSGVEIVVGTSERFSDEDIRGAMDAAMRAFHRGHSGCAMVRLAYNEAYQTCWLAGAGAGDDGGTIVLADDSGLEVDALNGEPGVYSARYMGEDTSYRIKNQSLVDRLEGVPVEKRTARFVCVIAAAFPDGTVCTTKGTIEGKIGYEERGENGFGYDPIFYLPDMSRTTAELSPEEKNAVSHRGKALAAMKEQIASYLK